MKKLAFMAIAMFALVFALGCTGGGEEEQATGGPGYDLTVSPTDVIEGGTVTVDLRVENIFEEDMENVKVDFKDISSVYNPDGEVSEATILPGQTYPVIMTLDAERAGVLSGKHIEVCFDYNTEYYFDVGLKSKQDATEELSTESGASDGPVGVTVTGMDNVFYENSKGVGAFTISNKWNGEIQSINSVSAKFPIGDLIESGKLSISDCTASTTEDSKVTTLESKMDECDIFTKKVAIANGLTLRAEVGVDKETTDLAVERVLGDIKYTYCYEIEMPTITIKAV